MSCWIVGNESIKKIVNSFYQFSKDNYFRRELKELFNIDLEKVKDEDLNKELEKFGQLLVNLNQESVNQRYEDKDKPFKFVYSNIKSLDIFQFLKSVGCYTYQSCEGNCYKTKLYLFMEKLENHLKDKIIHNLEEYKKAKWE